MTLIWRYIDEKWQCPEHTVWSWNDECCPVCGRRKQNEESG